MIEKQWCKDMHIDKQKVHDDINKLLFEMDGTRYPNTIYMFAERLIKELGV